MWFVHNLTADTIIKIVPIPVAPSSKQPSDITSRYMGTSSILIYFLIVHYSLHLGTHH